MKNNLAEEILKKMPLGWALHRFVKDKDGKPCDYIFVDVNEAFEELTGLSSVDIFGKKVTEVLPSILEDPFDWIKSYAKVAYNDEKMQFEQYSYSLDKWYRVNAYSMEEGSFITVIIDITKERKEAIDLNKMSVMSEAILQGLGEKSYYQKITDHFLDITDAKFAAFNLYDVDGKQYTTMAIAGDRGNIDKAMNMMSMKLEGKKWIHDFVRAGKIKDKIVTRFPTLHDLSGEVIPKLVCDLLTKSFGLGETVLVKIAKDNIMFGDFTLIMPKGKAFDKDSIAEILTRQLGLALSRARSEEFLRESEASLQVVLNATADGILAIGKDKKMLYVNERFSELWRVPSDVLESGDDSILLQHILDQLSDPEGFLQRLQEIYSSDQESFDAINFDDGRVFERLSRPLSKGSEVIGRVWSFREITQRRLAEESLQRFAEELERQQKDLQKRLHQSVNAISKIGELRDVYTAGHQKRVAELVLAIGKEMGLADEKISNLSYGGLLHDVGKFFVPSDILNKPGKVSALEYKIIQTHVEESYNVVKEIDFPEEIHTMIYQHHERLDGSGYPQGLTGDKIILESRILAVADVIEAMSSYRPYRAALGIEAALEEIELHKGTRFDTDVVDICIRLFKEKNFQFNEK